MAWSESVVLQTVHAKFLNVGHYVNMQLAAAAEQGLGAKECPLRIDYLIRSVLPPLESPLDTTLLYTEYYK